MYKIKHIQFTVEDTIDNLDKILAHPNILVKEFQRQILWTNFELIKRDNYKYHDNITSVRDNFPETLNYSEIQIQKAEKLKKKLPFYLFKNNKDIPFSYFYKINISGYEYIAQVNMIMDKAGNFSIKGF